MVKAGVVGRATAEIIRLAHSGLDSTTLRRRVLKALQPVVPVDAVWWATVDPATLLFTSAVRDDLPEKTTPLFVENEFLQIDSNKFTELVRTEVAARSLSEATRGDLSKSRRYREILVPLRLADELRAVLTLGGSCWGFLCLHREPSQAHFSQNDAAFLRRLGPHLAEGMRASFLLDAAEAAGEDAGPGVILLTDDFSMIGMTPAAEQWMASLGPEEWSRQTELPQAVYAVAARVRALERTSEGVSLVPRLRLQTASGKWFVLHASRLSRGMPHGPIAVIIEHPTPFELAPLIVEAYGLSPRERMVTQLVLQGLSTRAIAGRLFISANTVQDHLKAVFDKTGVRSRRELSAQILGRHYLRQAKAHNPIAPSGYFR